MGDALQERIAKLAAGHQRILSQADHRVSTKIRREWWQIELPQFGKVAVFFCPPQSQEELQSWPRYKGCRVSVG